MPVKRQYQTVPIKLADGGRLLTDLPVGMVGAANFDEKVNFVTEIGEVRKRAGWDYPAPMGDWTADGLADFNDGNPAEAIRGIRRPNGTYAIVGCGSGFIKYFDYDTNAWVTIGSGYSTQFDAGFRWWQIEDIAGYAVFNNGRDLPCSWQIGDATVLPIYEMREAGYASVGLITEYVDGVLMCADVLEIDDASQSFVMNSPSPYQTITEDTFVYDAAQVVWTARAAAAANSWKAVAWSAPLELFAAVAITGTGNRVMTSADGVTWTARASAADLNWSDIAWGAGLFVAVSSSGTTQRVMTSPDGITWTQRTTPNHNWQGVIFGGGQFVAVGSTFTMTSPDGITWTDQTNVTSFLISVAYGFGSFVAVTALGSVVTSPDGITWTLQTAPTGSFTDIAWSEELGMFAAIGNIIATSPDGVTWTQRTMPEANTWKSVAWNADAGLFVAVASTGTNRVMISSDGITWTVQASSEQNDWTGVAYGDGVGLIAAVAADGTNRVMTSNEGYVLVGTTRITYRRIWSNIGNPRDFAVSVPGSADAYVSPTDLTLAWPMASLAAGDTIEVLGAGADEGNLTTTIVSISGVDVVLTDPALTTVTDADVVRPTDVDSIAGYDDIEDDGSAIILQIPLKTQLITFKASGHIWQTYYTGDLDTPFAKDRVTKKAGAAPRFPRAVVNITNDDNQEYLLFPGSRHFYRFDLGSQAPQQEPLFMGAEKSLFFDRISGIGVYDVWAADCGATDEVFFAYLWDDYEVGYYGASRAIALRYAKNCESLSEIDAFNFTCGATVQKPLSGMQCDEIESWFLMGDGQGKITLYGQSNLAVLTRQRYGERFDASLGGGLTAFGGSDTGSYARRFSVVSSNPDATQTMEVSIYGARAANVAPTLLETRTLTDPQFPGAMGLYYRKPYYKYRIVSDTDGDLRISGFTWRVGQADTQDVDQLE